MIHRLKRLSNYRLTPVSYRWDHLPLYLYNDSPNKSQHLASNHERQHMAQHPDISFLGPLGTYSDDAAHRFAAQLGCPDTTTYRAHHSFSGVFESVESGESDYGVIALENSLEGPVTAALDDFVVHTGVKIIGEQVLDIHHCLLLAPGSSLESVTTIASHPQGLAQCRQFIKKNFPRCELLSAGSTAESARIAASDPHIAAIASAHAASLYHLDIALRDIEDVKSDQTSFALIAPKSSTTEFAGTPKKTSLLLFLKDNRPGALMMVLEEFAYAGMNLTKIQSRPTKKVLGEYLFFVDVDGSLDDADLRTALECLRLKLREVRILGCYPTFR